ncbi:putative ribonuclease H protein At1g65750 family [Senna tora]|uniref:Putative ribonuclease H protein At1g65750 family n=1 Tax=Senna tora TaxID=362788 RepID=A0A834SQC1_9FABA|nr:putative ribonuclease H protein At1g65750 family [Senna tora]
MEVAGQQKMVLQEIQNVVGPGGGEYGEKENVDPLSNRKSLRRYKKEARTCKQLIVKDLFRCIGDGRSTRVWGEAWIPGTFPYSIEKPNNIIAGELRVCDLLDDMGLWREEVLEFLFPTDICHRIKCIRTPEEGREDRWNWLGDAKGGFTNKGVEMAEGCTFCGMEEEGTYHVLVECPMLNVVWSGSRFDYGSRIWHNSISEWLAVEGNTWSQDQMGICVIALFLVWEARNAARFTDVNFRTDNFWCKVEGVWEEVQDSKSWKEWNDVFGRHLRWEKPKEGMVKLNTDAGTLADGGGVIGGIVRDSDGICVVAFTERVAMVCNPTVLEAEAIRRGMEVALRLGAKV